MNKLTESLYSGSSCCDHSDYAGQTYNPAYHIPENVSLRVVYEQLHFAGIEKCPKPIPYFQFGIICDKISKVTIVLTHSSSNS